MSFLGFEGKKFLVFGVANRKSVAYFIARRILEEGGEVVFSVLNEEKKKTVAKLFPGAPIYLCDVSRLEDIDKTAALIGERYPALDGVVHSIAFADYSDGLRPFHETRREAFTQAMEISCFSLVEISRALKPYLSPKASVVTISISTTRMASENYGYMAPVKAALDSAVCFLAKSFSEFSEIRFNAVAPSLLKTSASAGIPGYVDAYLFAEKATLRKRALQTEEAANTAVFLLSPASSGINAQKVVVDAGMGVNYFDKDIIKGHSG